MQFSADTINTISVLQQRRLERSDSRKPVTQDMLVNTFKAFVDRVEARGSSGAPPIPSIAKFVRGLMAIKRKPIIPATAEADAEFVRAVSTSTVPGQYLVPTITAKTIITQLAQFETFRAAGARIWPMEGIQKMTVPVGLTGPTFLWVAENSRQSASDPTFAAINFDLKNLQSFELVSAQLFKTVRPEFDVLLEDVYAAALAEAADDAMHASSTVAGAPTALMSAPITTLNCGSSPNGSNLAYSDLLAVVQKASDLKVRPPFVWIMNPRSWTRVLSLQSTTSQPIVVPGAAAPPAVGTLLGFPAYLTASISSTEALGSGTNQSHIIFTNPRAVNIGENSELSVMLSDQVAWEANQIGIRINRYTDWDFQPTASIVVLLGVS